MIFNSLIAQFCFSVIVLIFANSVACDSVFKSQPSNLQNPCCSASINGKAIWCPGCVVSSTAIAIAMITGFVLFVTQTQIDLLHAWRLETFKLAVLVVQIGGVIQYFLRAILIQRFLLLFQELKCYKVLQTGVLVTLKNAEKT